MPASEDIVTDETDFASSVVESDELTRRLVVLLDLGHFYLHSGFHRVVFDIRVTR
jgi:hypothetical protein